jgi:hypothetical protein
MFMPFAREAPKMSHIPQDCGPDGHNSGKAKNKKRLACNAPYCCHPFAGNYFYYGWAGGDASSAIYKLLNPFFFSVRA